MGASNFETTALGKTMSEAYARACREAEYEDGHNAYSGTIATTNGVLSIDALLAPFSAARREVIASAAIVAQRHDPQFDGPAVNKRGSWTNWVKVGIYGTWDIEKAVRPAERETVVRIAGLGIQKWGPCGGYEVTGKKAADYKARAKSYGRNVRGQRVFTFVGWAAE